MRFSTKTTYGLKVVLFLAERFGQGSVSASQIARKEGLSAAYLEQILHQLKKQNLVKTLRGPQGGYVLSKRPHEIDLKSLFYALNPKAFEGLKLAADAAGLSDAQIAERIFWNSLKGIVDEGLKDATLESLLAKVRDIRKSKKIESVTFHI